MADEELSLHDQLTAAFNDSIKENEEGIQSNESDRDNQVNDKTESNEFEMDKAGQDEKAVGSGEKSLEPGKINEGENNSGESGLDAPQHWSQADKDAFAQSPRSVQEWALRRDKEMTADYTRKTQEIANLRKTWEPLNEMFAPHIAQGVQVVPLIQSWAQVAQHLQQNPQEALQQLARQYNVDLTPKQKDDIWGDEKTQPVHDPRVSQLEMTIQQLTGHLQKRDQLEREAQVKTFENDIRAFAEQKTEAGTPAHPHFDELLPDMMMLAQAVRASGQQPKLQDLYDRALWANPSTREKTIAAQQKAAAKKAEEEAIAKAKSAKHAAKSVGGPSTGELKADMSLREMLESQF